MRIGLDSFALHPLQLDAFGELEWTRSHGFDGIQFGDVEGLYAGQDGGRLGELRSRADDHGLYTHVSVGGCSPFCTGLSEEALVEGLSRRVRLAAMYGWHELHGFLGGPRERYELETPFSEQLVVCRRVLTALGPVLRDQRSRINLETHGDASTFELIRLVEATGPDIVGICLDTANVMLQGEFPLMAARRAAAYTHLTHCKDAVVVVVKRGLRRQTLPPGSGMIDWTAVVAELAAVQPDLELSIEDHKWLFDAEVFEPRWQALNPEAPRDEVLELVRRGLETRQRIDSGKMQDPEDSEAVPYGDEMEERLRSGQEHLRSVVESLSGKSRRDAAR